jgi:hypothetical protein
MNKHISELEKYCELNFMWRTSIENRERFYNIFDSLVFAVDTLDVQHKVDYEFHNLLDFMEEIETERKDVRFVFDIWDNFINIDGSYNKTEYEK